MKALQKISYILSSEPSIIRSDYPVFKQCHDIFLSYKLAKNINNELKVMDLFHGHLVNIYDIDDDVFIITTNKIQMFYSKIAKLNKFTFGYWEFDKNYIIQWSRYFIQIFNLQLKIVLYLNNYIIDCFNDSECIYVENRYDSVYIFKCPRIMLSKVTIDTNNILTICRLKQDIFLVQYTNNDTFLIQNGKIIKHMSFVFPIFKTKFVYDYRFIIVFSLQMIYVLTEKEINHLINDEPHKAISFSYLQTVEPILTKDDILICIETDKTNLFISCCYIHQHFHFIRKKIPPSNYTFIHYDENTETINLGSENNIIQFKLFPYSG